MRNSAIMITFVVAILATFAVTPVASAAQPKKLDAFACGTFPVRVSATFDQKHNSARSQLKIDIKHGQPLQSYDVFINDQMIATITTNVAGNGKLKLRGPHDSVPQIEAGDTITIGDMTGTFMIKGKYRVEGRLDSDSELHGKVRYEERMHKDCQLERRFEVKIENAAPGESFDVSINDQFIGTVIADDEGEGKLQLRNQAFAHEDDEVMADDFPTLHEGDVVVVGSMSTTLTLKD